MIELDEKLNNFWLELKMQSEAFNTFEFDFFVEMLGVSWMVWFITIDEKSLKFTANDIYSDDLELLIKHGLIESVKEYKAELRWTEIERKRYRIVQNSTAKIL